MRINKKELASKINVTIPTLYNWEKTKPELMKIIKTYYDNVEKESEGSELLKYFYELDTDKQDLYFTKIKLEALEKKEKNKTKYNI